MGRRLRVALVMPARNEEEAVGPSLDAVFASTRLPDEIIVADGQSTDGTVARLRAYQNRGIDLRIVANPSRFSGGGRNIAIRHSTADVIVFVDFGNPMRPDYIEAMVRPFEESEDVDLVMGILLPLIETEFEHCLAAVQYYDNLKIPEYTREQKEALVPRVLLPGGGCIAVTREVYERLGGYPEWLHRSQDRLFSRKAYGMHVRVAVAWDAYTYNHLRKNVREVYDSSYTWGRGCGQSRYLRKRAIRMAVFYGTIAGLFAAAWWWWPAGLAAVLLLAAYFHRAGWKRLLQLDGGRTSLRRLGTVVSIVVARDLGDVVGHLVGWVEWFRVARYRKLFYEYTRGCDQKLLHVIER